MNESMEAFLQSTANWLGVNTNGTLEILCANGELLRISPKQFGNEIAQLSNFCVCHKLSHRRYFLSNMQPPADILELFAFAYPVRFTVPTIPGLLDALDLKTTDHLGLDLSHIAEHCLQKIVQMPKHKTLETLIYAMIYANWDWAFEIAMRLNFTDFDPPSDLFSRLRHWDFLPEWEEQPQRPPVSSQTITPDEARQTLSDIVHTHGEKRQQQYDYSAFIAHSFSSGRAQGLEAPFVLAEAATGIGKTLGYLAPAIKWSDRNEGSVWFSTYTRHLQRQIIDELKNIFPNPDVFDKRVVMRKGRENYLCLLNLEESLQSGTSNPKIIIALTLIIRWLMNDHSGDLTSGRFPSWLFEIMGKQFITELGDRRGECIHSSCAHWKKCFIETNQRKTQYGDFIVINMDPDKVSAV
ncbi:MAG: DEAD/DEAH box helicase [Pseudomonadota bacterium]